MDAATFRQRPAEADEDSVGKAISDIDTAVQALLSGLPAAKPWQRQLLAHLRHADRNIEVLRLTISLNRDLNEICQAADSLVLSLRSANVYLRVGRADIVTKAALNIAWRVSQKIRSQLGA